MKHALAAFALAIASLSSACTSNYAVRFQGRVVSVAPEAVSPGAADVAPGVYDVAAENKHGELLRAQMGDPVDGAHVVVTLKIGASTRIVQDAVWLDGQDVFVFSASGQSRSGGLEEIEVKAEAPGKATVVRAFPYSRKNFPAAVIAVLGDAAPAPQSAPR